MPFVAHLRQTTNHKSKGCYADVRKPANANNYSDIQVPVKVLPSSSSTIDDGRGGSNTLTIETYCSAVPFIRYDGGVVGDNTTTDSLYDAVVGGIRGLPPHLLYGGDAATTDQCVASNDVKAAEAVQQRPPHNRQQHTTTVVNGRHPHCGQSWDVVVEDASAAEIKMTRDDTQPHITTTTASSNGTPMLHFLEGGIAHQEEEDDDPLNTTIAAPAKVVAKEEEVHDDANEVKAMEPQQQQQQGDDALLLQQQQQQNVDSYTDRHLYPFINFLRRYPGMTHMLLKSARKSKFLSKHADIRFVALFLLQQYVAKTSAAGEEAVRGPRHQAVLVATCLFLAAKFCDQNAQIRHVLGEAGLAAAATVNANDVYDHEFLILKACGYHVQVPRYWQACCEVALSAPHAGGGGDALTPQTRLRIQHVAMFMDRQLVEISRNRALQLAILQMNADELALGCSVAVAGSMASPTEATVALFDSVVVAPLNINFQTLQAEALHEYVKCLGHLAGVLLTAITTPTTM